MMNDDDDDHDNEDDGNDNDLVSEVKRPATPSSAASGVASSRQKVATPE